MFELRKMTWLLVAFWLLAQSAAFAHTFDEHSVDSDCATCIQIQHSNEVLEPSNDSHTVPALEAPRLAPQKTQAFSNYSQLHAKARAPPFS